MYIIFRLYKYNSKEWHSMNIVLLDKMWLFAGVMKWQSVHHKWSMWPVSGIFVDGPVVVAVVVAVVYAHAFLFFLPQLLHAAHVGSAESGLWEEDNNF